MIFSQLLLQRTFTLFISCYLLTNTATTFASSNSNHVVIGGDYNYPPYEFINADNEPDGFNTELSRAIAEVMGISIEIKLGSWDDMRHNLLNNKVDVLQGMVFSQAREATFQFSPSHAIITQSIFARKENASASTIADLKDKSIIVQRAGIMHDYLVSNNVSKHLILVDTHAAALRLLASGQHDYALVANLPGLYLGRELELSNIVAVGKPFGTQRYGFAVLKGNSELLAQFSEGLAILKNTGRYKKIYDKWLGPLENDGWPWSEIAKITALVSSLLLLLLFAITIWNRMLSRQVSKRTQELHIHQKQLIQADKMASLGTLVSGVAHEINNPNSLLLLNLPLLKECAQDIDTILDEKLQISDEITIGGLPYSRMRKELPLLIDDMLESSLRIKRIVEDLRDFSQHKTAKLNEQVNLNEVTSAAIRLVDRTIKSSTHAFHVHYAQQLPSIKGNSQRIEQVIINLILNACQALDNKEQSISIKIEYQSEKHQVSFVIVDEGRGISQEHLARLKDPFFTTHRETGGTGLGLYISSNIIDEHQGKLFFDSKHGKTYASFTFPVDSELLYEQQ